MSAPSGPPPAQWSGAPSPSYSPAGPPGPRPSRRRWPLAVALVAVAGLCVGCALLGVIVAALRGDAPGLPAIGEPQCSYAYGGVANPCPGRKVRPPASRGSRMGVMEAAQDGGGPHAAARDRRNRAFPRDNGGLLRQV